MKTGIYEATFTTSVGTLGKSAVLINRNTFVGADGLQFYRGEFDYQAHGKVSVIMEVTRHNFAAESPLGSQPIFTLTWSGLVVSDDTFKLECEPEGSSIRIYVTGTLIKAFD